MNKKGLVYVFTGDGKGKTSAAFWTGVRMALRGRRVAAVQFYKEARWPTAVQELSRKFKNFEVYLSGKGFYQLPTDHASKREHKKAAGEGLKKAGQLIKSSRYSLVILDEINNAMKDRLVKVEDVLRVLKNRGKTHVVLTGRYASKSVIRVADLVTEMEKVKHPFDKGVKAVKGLDF